MDFLCFCFSQRSLGRLREDLALSTPGSCFLRRCLWQRLSSVGPRPHMADVRTLAELRHGRERVFGHRGFVPVEEVAASHSEHGPFWIHIDVNLTCAARHGGMFGRERV